MKNLFKKSYIAVLGFFAFIGSLFSAKIVSAAPDADLGTALASTTAWADDNKSQILTYIVALIFIVFVITIAKKAILWGFAKLSGVFGRGRRR